MMPSARWLQPILTLAVVASLSGSAAAVEPVDQFLAALRERRLFDQAMDYLDLLAVDERVDQQVRQRVLYEQGVTLLVSTAGLKDLAARDAQLSRSADLIQQFMAKFPDHPLAGSAKVQLANILIERARSQVAAGQSPDGKALDEKQRESRLRNARERFEEARRQFDAADKDLNAELQKLPKLVDPSDEPLRARKQQLVGDVAQVRLLRPSIDYELAATYAPGSVECKTCSRRAAESYHALYETYRTRAAGLLARLWEGRSLQQMGDVQQALACYRELMDLPATPDTRSLKTKSTRQALECLMADGEKKYAEAIERGQKWEKESGDAATDADALAIRYWTALAYDAQSNALPAKDPNRKKLAGFARQYVVPVASHPGEYQRPARMLLVALGGSKDSKDKGAARTTFADAFDRAKQALERMQEAEAGLKQKPKKAVADALAKQKASDAVIARQALQLALAVSDSKVSIEDLNSARYYLCYLEWDAGHLYDAAVLGDFLARRYPDSLPGRQGARIALAAYIKMHTESKQADKQFETAQVERMATEIFTRWPDQEESDEAALSMLSFAVSQNQWEKAIDYLKRVSMNSPRRGQAELRAGQALWSAYLRRSQLPADERPPQAELDALKKQAQDVLGQGIARMEKAAEVDPSLVSAVFAMAQICVDTGQPAEAIGWLERPKIGPLALVKAGSPLAQRESFAIETYKLACVRILPCIRSSLKMPKRRWMRWKNWSKARATRRPPKI